MPPKRVHCSIDCTEAPLVELKFYDDENVKSQGSRRKKGRTKPAPTKISFTVADSSLSRDPHISPRPNNIAPANPNVSQGEPSTSEPPGLTVNDPVLHDEPDYLAQALERDSSQPEAVPIASKKNPNYYLRLWLDDYSDLYVHAGYDREAPPESPGCSFCLECVDMLYRCTFCLGSPRFCGSCLLNSHRLLPTHRPEVWDGALWRDSCLASLGLVLHLGHGGQPCDQNESNNSILVGDLTGFTTVNVRYCTHQDCPSKPEQLIRNGLFPCSERSPQSAFTLFLLQKLNVLVTLGRTSFHKYYLTLVRLTKPGFPEDVDDRYRELLTTYRKFLHTTNLQRSGRHFYSHPTEVHKDDQALDCVACPRPGINFEWDEVSPSDRPWFRVGISYDGNARSVRKAKKVDSGDMCFSDGLAYVPLKAPYKEWVARTDHGPQRTEKPACDNHKAGNDTSGRWAGRDVTGVGAFTCTSHSCFIPRGMVDYDKGERHIYTDYAFASVARYLYERGRIDIFMTYDVWCHWFVRFLQHRAPKLPPHIALPIGLVLSGAIPKWHIIGHQLSCWIRYSLDHTQYVGRLEGEGPERVWAHMNEHSGSTSEQGPGMRTDNINNMAYEWNYEKMIGLAKALPAKFEEAKVMLAKQKEIHEELTSSLPAVKIKHWETESIEPTQINGKWTSPLADPILNYGKFQSSIKDAWEEESPTARVAGKRPGATRWLSEGIELEHSIRKLQDEAKEFGTHPTPKQMNAFNAQVSSLRDRLTAHHQQRPTFMPTLGDPDHPGFQPFTDEWTEGFNVVLPSSYAPETLHAAGLASLLKVEIRLRKGMCGDSIESTKRLLGVKDMAISQRNRHLSGEIATTRAQSRIRTHTAKVKKAQWRYENSRKALIRLGATESDLDHYRELGDQDLQSLKTYLEEVSRGIGQGYTQISWIWRNGVAPNAEDWAVEVLKPEWFRSRERYKRWEEQLYLIKREMVMAIRSFRKFQEIWLWKSERSNCTAGMRAYARRRSAFFRELGDRMFVASRKHLEDDVVTFEWCDEWLKNHIIAEAKSVQSHSS